MTFVDFLEITSYRILGYYSRENQEIRSGNLTFYMITFTMKNQNDLEPKHTFTINCNSIIHTKSSMDLVMFVKSISSSGFFENAKPKKTPTHP